MSTSAPTPPNRREDFAHMIRIRYGTAPSEPTERQLDAIIVDIGSVPPTTPITIGELGKIVARHCPTAGTHKYGQDVSDLQAIAEAIRNAGKK